jgi:hypothetical protein
MAHDTRYTESGPVTGWVGWIWFAAVVMILVGVFNVIHGLVAIFNGDFFVETMDRVIVFNLVTWGWIHLILGILLVAVGAALVVGQTWARVVAVVLVALNAIGQLTFITVFPWWSVLVIAIDLVVLYALIVHGRETQAFRP